MPKSTAISLSVEFIFKICKKKNVPNISYYLI